MDRIMEESIWGSIKEWITGWIERWMGRRMDKGADREMGRWMDREIDRGAEEIIVGDRRRVSPVLLWLSFSDCLSRFSVLAVLS
jgi:hypothetical protein